MDPTQVGPSDERCVHTVNNETQSQTVIKITLLYLLFFWDQNRPKFLSVPFQHFLHFRDLSGYRLEVGRHDHMRVTSSSWYDDSVTAGWPFLPFLSFQSNPQQFYFLLGRVSSAANPTHSPFVLKTILLTRKSFVNERQHKNPRTQKQTERERDAYKLFPPIPFPPTQKKHNPF